MNFGFVGSLAPGSVSSTAILTIPAQTVANYMRLFECRIVLGGAAAKKKKKIGVTMVMKNGATPVDSAFFDTKAFTAEDSKSTVVCFLLAVCGNQSGALTIDVEIKSKQIPNLTAEFDYLEVAAARENEFSTPGLTLQPYPTLSDVPISDALWILPFQSPVIQPIDNLDDPINAWDGFYTTHAPSVITGTHAGLRYAYRENGDADMTYVILDKLKRPVVPSFETHEVLTTIRAKSSSKAYPKFPRTHSGVCDIIEITNGQDADKRFAKSIITFNGKATVDPTKQIEPPTGAAAMFGFKNATDVGAGKIVIGVKKSPLDTDPYLTLTLTGLRWTTSSMDKFPSLNVPDLTAIYLVTVCLGATNALTGTLAAKDHIIGVQPQYDYANSTSSTPQNIYEAASIYARSGPPTNYPVYHVSKWRSPNTAQKIKDVVDDFRPLLPFTLQHKIYEFGDYSNSFMQIPNVAQAINFLTPDMDSDESDLSIVQQVGGTIDQIIGEGNTQIVATQLGNAAKQQAMQWGTQYVNQILNGIAQTPIVARNVWAVKSHTAGQAASAETMEL